jgi:hypothetical protein
MFAYLIVRRGVKMEVAARTRESTRTTGVERRGARDAGTHAPGPHGRRKPGARSTDWQDPGPETSAGGGGTGGGSIMELWCEEADGRWGRTPIVRSVRIGDDDGVVVAAGVANARAIIIPYKEHARVCAVLVCGLGAGTAVTVNGYPPLGVTLLDDRDDIVIWGEPGRSPKRFVFAEREPARVVEFSEITVSPGEGRCGRCQRPLESGDAAVRCPACQRWFHEGLRKSGERRKCWSYDPLCGGCHTSRAAMSWSPAGGEDQEEVAA